MNNRGQMGMGLLFGTIVALFMFIMLSAFMPVIIQQLNTIKGSNSANCAGYTDPNGLYSYNESLSTNQLTCSIVDFTPGLYILAVIFSIISGVITGSIYTSMNQPQQQQQPYYQYQA